MPCLAALLLLFLSLLLLGLLSLCSLVNFHFSIYLSILAKRIKKSISLRRTYIRGRVRPWHASVSHRLSSILGIKTIVVILSLGVKQYAACRRLTYTREGSHLVGIIIKAKSSSTSDIILRS